MASSRLIGVLTGEVGSGKSTAARAFSSRPDPTKNPVVYVSDSLLDPRGFYREALWQLGVAPAFLRADARRQFSAVLMDLWESQGKSPVIIVDEAHGLSQEMPNEMRYITNFRLDSLSPFSLILVGQTELRAHLRLKSLEAVKQRVSVRYHLPPLPAPIANMHYPLEIAKNPKRSLTVLNTTCCIAVPVPLELLVRFSALVMAASQEVLNLRFQHLLERR